MNNERGKTFPGGTSDVHSIEPRGLKSIWPDGLGGKRIVRYGAAAAIATAAVFESAACSTTGAAPDVQSSDSANTENINDYRASIRFLDRTTDDSGTYTNPDAVQVLNSWAESQGIQPNEIDQTTQFYAIDMGNDGTEDVYLAMTANGEQSLDAFFITRDGDHFFVEKAEKQLVLNNGPQALYPTTITLRSSRYEITNYYDENRTLGESWIDNLSPDDGLGSVKLDLTFLKSGATNSNNFINVEFTPDDLPQSGNQDTENPSGAMSTVTPTSSATAETGTGSSGGSGGSGGPSPETPTPTPTVAATEAPTQTPTVEAEEFEPLNLGDNPELFLDIAENAAETGTVVEFTGPVTGRTIRYIVYNPQNKPDWARMEERVALMQARLDQTFNPHTHGDATYAEVIDTYFDRVLKQADPDGDGTAEAVLIRTGNGSNGTASRYSEMSAPLDDIRVINIVLGDGNNSESGADGADFMGTGHRTSRPSSEPNTKFASYYQDGQMFFAFLPESTARGSNSLEEFAFPDENLSDGNMGGFILFSSWGMATFGNTDKTQAALFTRPETGSLAWRYLTGSDLNTLSADPDNSNANLVNMFAYPSEVLLVSE